MKFTSLLSLIVLFLSVSTNSYNINHTFPVLHSSYLALRLVGNESSDFPGSSFLNYILYGTKEQLFFYYEFLLNYGSKALNCSDGNLVIGNDALLGGICFGDNSEVIIPIYGSKIESVPIFDP